MLEISTPLLPHQEEHSDKISKRRSILMVSKTGSGKTLTCLAAFIKLYNADKATHMFVFTPLSAYAKKVWHLEAEKHTSAKAISVDSLISETRGNLDKAEDLLKDYQIVYGKHTMFRDPLNFSFITKMMDRVNPVLVYDEIHAFRNPKAIVTKYARQANGRAIAVWGLTATPLSTSLENTYHIYNFIRPGILGSFWEFMAIHCITHEERYGLRVVKKIDGYKDLPAFQAIVEPYTISTESTLFPHYHFIEYTMSQEETDIYAAIGKGLLENMDTTSSDEDWLASVLAKADEEPHEDDFLQEEKRIKKLDTHGTRFIYLQYAADGIISPVGKIGSWQFGDKIRRNADKVVEIIQSGRSVLVYFSYYSSMEVFREYLLSLKGLPEYRLLESSGKKVLKDTDVTEEDVAKVPHVILCTKAGSESVSYYFINNLIFFHVGTTPDVFTQMVGRITRTNSLYPDDLHVYIPKNENIDTYKMRLLSAKGKQMEGVTNTEANIPDFYKGEPWNAKSIRTLKRYLLWQKKKKNMDVLY